MIRPTLLLLALSFLMADPGHAVVLCKGAGALTYLRETCRRKETRVNPNNLYAPVQRGVFHVSGFAVGLGQTFSESHSLAFQMDAALPGERIIVLPGGTSDANCPGSVDRPFAAAGYLCLFLSPQSLPGWRLSVLNPGTLEPGTSPSGFILQIAANANGLNKEISALGTWAIGGTR